MDGWMDGWMDFYVQFNIKGYYLQRMLVYHTHRR
jgi:hypothetical protein